MFKKLYLPALLISLITACGDSKTTAEQDNIAPVANAGEDIQVIEGATVVLDASLSSDDGVIATYFWQQVAGASIELVQQNAKTITFQTPEITQEQTLSFELTVTDNKGSVNSDTVTVIVSPYIANVHQQAIILTEDYHAKFGSSILETGNNQLLIITLNENNINGSDLKVARYNKDLTLDLSYGEQGYANIPENLLNNLFDGDSWNKPLITQAQLMPDDSLVFGGQSFAWDGELLLNEHRSYFVSLSNEGKLSEDIGQNGIIEDQPANENIRFGEDLSVSNDGSIIYLYSASAQRLSSVTKYLKNGDVDQTFGVNGIVDFPNTELDNIKALADGSFIIVGEKSSTEVGGDLETGRLDLIVFKLTPDGSIDTNFGNEGSVTFPTEWAQDYETFVIGNDIYIGASQLYPENGQYRSAFAKLDITGNKNAIFGEEGLLFIDGYEGSRLQHFAVQNNQLTTFNYNGQENSYDIFTYDFSGNSVDIFDGTSALSGQEFNISNSVYSNRMILNHGFLQDNTGDIFFINDSYNNGSATLIKYSIEAQ